MKLLDDYLSLQQQIYSYFGYQEQFRVFPIDDKRDMYWWTDYREISYAKSNQDFKSGNYYCDEIYNQHHLPKWVYHGSEYTMFVVDTHVDGNKFLSIYDNQKELKESPF